MFTPYILFSEDNNLLPGIFTPFSTSPMNPGDIFNCLAKATLRLMHNASLTDVIRAPIILFSSEEYFSLDIILYRVYFSSMGLISIINKLAIRNTSERKKAKARGTCKITSSEYQAHDLPLVLLLSFLKSAIKSSDFAVIVRPCVTGTPVFPLGAFGNVGPFFLMPLSITAILTCSSLVVSQTSTTLGAI